MGQALNVVEREDRPDSLRQLEKRRHELRNDPYGYKLTELLIYMYESARSSFA
jgi:hypothetical protein